MSMATTPRRKVTPREAARVLAEQEPVIARLLAETGPPSFPAPTETHFGTLVRAITFQQLAGAAARAIHGRLIAALDGDVAPEGLLALSDEALRAVGLSGAKVASLRDLSARVLDGPVVREPRRLARLSDADVVARLSEVRGIGRWTGEMFLLFQLRRLDVWPTGALGVGRGYGLAWGVAPPPPACVWAPGRPRRPAGLRPGRGRPPAYAEAARCAGRAVSPLPQRRRL